MTRQAYRKGNGTYVSRRGGSSATVAPLIWYNVRDYGATGDGVTDDSAAIQSAVNAAIATGGIVTGPPGDTYNIVAAGIDFSAMKSATGAKPVAFLFAGGGTGQPGQAHLPTFGASTVFLNGTGGPVITAQGAASTQPIVGLKLSGFGVKNTAPLASGAFTILCDYVTERGVLEDIYVYANGQGGNGIAFMNFPIGQGYFDRVVAQGFTSGTPNGIGIKISIEATAGVPSTLNCGNMMFRSCAVRDARVGWNINAGQTLNGNVFSACKAVNSTDIVGSIGWLINGAGVTQNVFDGCHAEKFSTPFAVSNASLNTFLSPNTSYPSGTPDANSAGFRFYGSAFGNKVVNHRAAQTHYAVSFEDTAKSNTWEGDDISGGRVLTALIRDITSITPPTNITRRIEDGSTTPVVNLSGHSVLVDGFEAIGPELAKLTTGEATIPRLVANLGNVATMSTGVFRLTYFTARKTETITQLRLSSGTTAAGATPTLVRAGIWLIDSVASRSVTDGVSNGTTTITSATAAFTSADVYRTITGTDIPAGTYIASVTNATTAVLSQAASGSHTGDSWTIGGVGNGALVAAIANDTSIFAATNTEYLRSLTSNFPKVKGQRYALGILVVTAAAAPLLGGAQILGAGGNAGAAAAGRGPRISGALTAQADLPGSFTDASLTATGNMVYAELVP